MATFNGTTSSDTLSGSGLSDLLAGLAGNDSIADALGDDTLDGGTGFDTLDGGAGNDTYVVDSTRDVIHESGADASDRVQASITIDLNNAAYDGIEHVTLTGTAALNATGDDAANLLIGNSGANKLDGGVGADTMLGGAGNDTYTVDNGKDVVIELAGEGTDQVNSAFTFTLSDFVENLTLTGSSDSAGTGNALANKITGNAAPNALDGGDGETNDTLIGNEGDDTLDGGNGADSMSGGSGNDSYVVDDSGDKITESGPATDRDRVESGITYTLGSNLEELFLQGTQAIDGTGNSLNNLITGNVNVNTLSGLAGNDTLNGFSGGDLLMGGDGNDQLQGASNGDTLVGGAGSDTFAFFASSGKDRDLVADFNGLPGGDLIDVGDFLNGKGVTAANADQFLDAVSAGGNTTLRLDSNGGANSFVDLAVLQGVSTDLDGLLANASILGVGALTATTLVGTNGGDTLAAGTTSQLVEGLGGNDQLSGGIGNGFDTLDGGTGSDTLAGGDGSDTYIIDSAGDRIIETAGKDDRILASISIDLNNVAYDGVEHVTLSGAGALNATGDGDANMLIGNTGANKLDGGVGSDTMIGGAGNDTYTVDSSTDAIVEYANEGTEQVNSAASFTLSNFVENLTLTGTADIDGTGNALANKITGNSGANALDGGDGNDTLTGNDGSDSLDGGAGADSLVGGKGDDHYIVDDPGDKISETGPSTETDSVFASISYALGATLENLTLTGSDRIDGTGNALNNVITGNGEDNVLSGLAGNDLLDGSFGNDLLLGGDGNDLLRVTTVGSADTLVGGSGSDIFELDVDTSFLGPISRIGDFNGLPGGDLIDLTQLLPGGLGFTDALLHLETRTDHGSTILSVDPDGPGGNLPLDVVELFGVSTDAFGLLDNASIIGVAGLVATPVVGTSAADTLVTGSPQLVQGLAGNDTLTGSFGSDTLDGGTGTDRMTGGTGNDTYIVDNAKDVIVETGGDTDDRIQASISIDLNAAAYANIEHVTLTGTGALHATGNGGENLLIGNAGANILDGQGGADTLAGGAGNDTYTVDNINDSVIENPGEGTDQVNSAVSFILGDNVENLTLTGTSGEAGNGNDLANKITGNSGDNFLSGNGGNDTLTGNDGADHLIGGSGADSMVGGTGNDTYDVDDSGDKVSETSATGGTDTVNSEITYTLGSNVENLTLADGRAIDGTGNSLNNVITGGDDDNVLSGLAGNDTLVGGAGKDLLLGGDGADLLQAAEGADTLTGGAGSDRFVFDSKSLNGVDVISDFTSAPGGDVLDVSDLLTGFNPATSNINDFLKAVEGNGSTTIQVDANGGGNSFVDMAVLGGVNTDIMGLLNNGSLVLAH